ncbi:hypothetical protein MHBO_001370 [Bonamia ostreae]|uniref:LAGLIDADG homing endonuclease n=1 Tax=Bonamia ostreae TaxID=126728 RepID=A0ABV2AIQ7_9EUKA
MLTGSNTKFFIQRETNLKIKQSPKGLPKFYFNDDPFGLKFLRCFNGFLEYTTENSEIDKKGFRGLMRVSDCENSLCLNVDYSNFLMRVLFVRFAFII